MKLLLAPLLLAVSLPAFAGAHEECLKAVDYKGCLEARLAIEKPVIRASNNKYFSEKLPTYLFTHLTGSSGPYSNKQGNEEKVILLNKCYDALPDESNELNTTICSFFISNFNILGQPVNTVDSLNNRLQKAIDEWTDPEILADAAKHNAKFKSSKTYFDVVSPQNELKYTSPCPPGKSLRQKRIFLGLIKLGKVCLSDYEVENLNQRERHRALDNFSDSMKSLGETINPKRINCSTRYGSYSSNTTCY